MRIVLLVQRGNLQPSLDHGAFALLDGQRQPLDGVHVEGFVVLLADGEIGALGELAAVEGLADKNHHAVELNLNPQLDAVQESGLLGEEILVQDGESGGIISIRVQVLGGSVERGLTVGGEGVLGAFEIVGGGDALEIGGETLVTTGGVPGGDVLAESSEAGT